MRVYRTVFPLFLSTPFAVLALAGGCRAASLPAQTFEQATGLNGLVTVWDAAVDGAGNVVFATGDALHKYNHFGTRVFSQPWTMTAVALALGAGGEIYLTGAVQTGGVSDLALAKYSPSGELAWLYTEGGSGNDEGRDIVVDDQGGIYAAGFTTVANQSDLFVVKYDTEGAQQWTREFNGSANGSDSARFLTPVPGGGVTAFGLTANPAAAFLTIRYDAAGTAAWTSIFDAPDVTESAPVGLERTSDGGFVVAGRSGSSPIVVKYSESGAELWAKPISGAIAVGALAAGPAGDAVVMSMGPMRTDSIGLPQVGPVSVSSISEAGPGWSTLLGESETLSALLIRGDAGGYYAASGYSTRYHTQHALLAGLKSDGSDLTIAPLPGFLSNILGGPVSTRMLAAGADGSVWMIYNSPLSGSLLLRRYGAPVPPPAPEVITGEFENPLASSVVLTGTIDPKGAAVSWRFEYGLTPSYGSATSTQQLSGAAAETVSATLEGLVPRRVYHYRLVGIRGAATFPGEDRAVQTLDHYQIWARAMFGSFDAPGSAPLEDPDGDGSVNLMEYAFGTEGNVSNRGAGLPAFEMWRSVDSGWVYPSLVYRWDATRSGVSMTPLASHDLINWTQAGIAVREEPGGMRRAVAEGMQRYMKLKVTLQ